MTITNQDQLFDALANNASRFIVDKASLANAVAGGLFSLWRATGQPAQAALPTVAAIPTSATLGAIGFTNQTSPVTSYLPWMQLTSSNNAMSAEVHDRIAHNANGELNITTLQTDVAVDLSTLGVVAARLGAADYSDAQWWLEVYADGGATASNATINVTYNDASTGNLNVVAVGGTLRAGRLLPLTPLIPTAKQGFFIRGINSVQLSASTGTAGNFGFTATRHRTVVPMPLANFPGVIAWNTSGSPEIANDACLQFIIQTSTTTTGTLRGTGKIAHG